MLIHGKDNKEEFRVANEDTLHIRIAADDACTKMTSTSSEATKKQKTVRKASHRTRNNTVYVMETATDMAIALAWWLTFHPDIATW